MNTITKTIILSVLIIAVPRTWGKPTAKIGNLKEAASIRMDVPGYSQESILLLTTRKGARPEYQIAFFASDELVTSKKLPENVYRFVTDRLQTAIDKRKGSNLSPALCDRMGKVSWIEENVKKGLHFCWDKSGQQEAKALLDWYSTVSVLR